MFPLQLQKYRKKVLSNCLKRNSGNTGHESTSGADCMFCISFEIVDFCPLQQNIAFMRADSIVRLHKKKQYKVTVAVGAF